MGNCLSSQDADDISLIRESEGSDSGSRSEPPPPYQESQVATIYHPSPSVSRPASQLTEVEQIQIAQRLGLINHLPMGLYDGTSKKAKECVICMVEFAMGDMLRFLPCMHVYHKDCIDDWLMRSLTCPSCMEPVDAALLSSYETS
ncbi:RING finger protein 11-like [Babylonia areolata]|uniref:RING finger protein 11-like n=1 Tax=Babylonia areolata TaxID=304850 RepID=UPI003FD3B9CF